MMQSQVNLNERSPLVVNKEIPLHPLTKEMLELSSLFSEETKHNFITTGHILLSLAKINEEITDKILYKHLFNLNIIRQRVIELLDKDIEKEQEDVKPSHKSEGNDIQNVQERLNKHELDEVFKNLSKHESTVICFRYGLKGYKEHNLEETDSEFQITRQEIRRIEASFLRRLRSH
jgi:ATP-dependent Clp protease ATP-binding subunit ClpA